MHTTNLTQRFLANQPWKNPHGENQSERERSLLFSSAMYRTENDEKYNLSPPANFFTKSGNVLSKPSRTPFSISVPEINANVQQQTGRTSPRKLCQQNSPYSSSEIRTSNKCTVLSRYLCQQFNAGRTPRKPCQINADNFLDFCAVFNAAVQPTDRPYSPRILCNIKCSRTVINAGRTSSWKLCQH